MTFDAIRRLKIWSRKTPLTTNSNKISTNNSSNSIIDIFLHNIRSKVVGQMLEMLIKNTFHIIGLPKWAINLTKYIPFTFMINGYSTTLAMLGKFSGRALGVDIFENNKIFTDPTNSYLGFIARPIKSLIDGKVQEELCTQAINTMNETNGLIKPIITAATTSVIIGAVAKHNDVPLPDFSKTIEKLSLIDPFTIGLTVLAISTVLIISYLYFPSENISEQEKIFNKELNKKSTNEEIKETNDENEL